MPYCAILLISSYSNRLTTCINRRPKRLDNCAHNFMQITCTQWPIAPSPLFVFVVHHMSLPARVFVCDASLDTVVSTEGRPSFIVLKSPPPSTPTLGEVFCFSPSASLTLSTFLRKNFPQLASLNKSLTFVDSSNLDSTFLLLICAGIFHFYLISVR